MSFQGRIRTFYRHESSARKGEKWAADKIDEILSQGRKLPDIGPGYSNLYRAAHLVRSIAENKLQWNIPAHERVFWTSASDEANAVLGTIVRDEGAAADRDEGRAAEAAARVAKILRRVHRWSDEPLTVIRQKGPIELSPGYDIHGRAGVAARVTRDGTIHLVLGAIDENKIPAVRSAAAELSFEVKFGMSPED